MRKYWNGTLLIGVSLALFGSLPFGAKAQVELASPGKVHNPEAHYDFYGRGPYRKEVPRPSTILGYEAGEWHSTFRDQEKVLLALANSAHDRVRIVEYGKSVEGRPLRLILVSSAENLSHLEHIRDDIAKLADPRRLQSEAEADAITATSPVITWINHCIHGSETASFETVMWTLYTLIASEAPEVRDALHRSVIVLNPVFNPDGHERYVVYYNSVAVGSPESWAFEKEIPWAVEGRYNHYRFDMNRDKLAQSQPETRQETAAFLNWHPQVFADEHGQPDTYFFPPNALPANRQVDRERLEKWTDLFGRANSAVFDRYGWPYVNRETFDFFYPGYLDSWTTLSGAIGMTYETDGGGNLARRRNDETISTLRDAMAHHLESSMSTIFTAAQHREMLLRDYLAYRRHAMQPVAADKARTIVILPGADIGRAEELATVLRRVGVEVGESQAPSVVEKAHPYLPGISASGKPVESAKHLDIPAGALVIKLNQPQGRVARAFLEPDNDFEPEFVKEQMARRDRNDKRNENEPKEDYQFYDISAWSLAYSYGLESYWLEDLPSLPTRALEMDRSGSVVLSAHSGGIINNEKAVVAYLFRYDRDAAAYLALRLLQEGYHLSVATKPVRVGKAEWPRGTLIARVSRNPDTLAGRLGTLARELGVDVHSIGSFYGDDGSVDLGSDSVVPLRKPVVAVVEDEAVSQTSYGAVWWMFERQVGLSFTSVRLKTLKSMELSRFNAIIFPDGGGYAAELGKSGIDALREWVNRGGALIGLGDGGVWFTDKEANLTTATVVGADAKPEEKGKKPISLAGSIFRAHIDATHFLGYGYENGDIAVPLSASTFLKPSKQGANVVTFGKGPARLSGFIWPNNTEELLANTAYVVDEPTGNGHVILYLSDPTFRALWAGLRRMFLSSILFGPGATALTSP